MSFDPTKVKSVIFDWGGVCCVAAEPFASGALQKALHMNPDEIAAEIRDIYEDHYRGKYTTEAFWSAVLSHFNLETSVEINPHALTKAYLESYTIYPEVLALAKKLKEKYTVGLLSNLSPVMRDHIREIHRTEEYFNPEVYSCDQGVGVIKPDKEVYKIFLTKLGQKAEECLFIDDSQKNLDAAEKLEFQTLLFKTPQQFLEDIALLP